MFDRLGAGCAPGTTLPAGTWGRHRSAQPVRLGQDFVPQGESDTLKACSACCCMCIIDK